MPTYPTYKLSDVAEIINGKNQKEVVSSKGEYPIYGSGGIIGWATDYLCKENSTIIGRKGTIDSPIFVNRKFWNVDTAFGIQPSDKILPRYLFFFCKSFDFRKLDKSTTIPSLAKRDLLQIPIPLPPLPTQHAIVTRIETLFAELDKAVLHLRTARQQLKTYRQAVLNKFLTDGSENWEKVKLGKVIDKPTYGTSKKCDYNFEGTGVLRIPNIGDGYIIDEDLKFASFTDEEKKKYSLQDGDLLTIRSNGSIDLVGKCALISEKDEKLLFAGYLIRLRPNKEKVNSKFLLFSLESHELRIQIEDKAKSTSGVNNINSVELQNLEILLPSLSEQQRIVKKIESRLSQATASEAYIENALQQAEALRQSILKKAFSGELV